MKLSNPTVNLNNIVETPKYATRFKERSGISDETYSGDSLDLSSESDKAPEQDCKAPWQEFLQSEKVSSADLNSKLFEDFPVWRVVKTLFYLLSLAIIYIPLCICLSIKYYLFKYKPVENKGITVVVTGVRMSKGTMLLKWFGKAGYKVVVVESEDFWCAGSRFSKYVSEFHTIPSKCPKAYVKNLVQIVKDCKAQYFIPACSPATEEWDAMVADELSADGVMCLQLPYKESQALGHKFEFTKIMKESRVPTPETFLLESDDDVFRVNEELKERSVQQTFILKNNQFDPMHRLDLFELPASDTDITAYLSKIRRDGNPITLDAPWVAQRFVDGQMWTSLHVQVKGQMCLYSSTKATASCFTWANETNDQIKTWNQRLAATLPVNGILCNDFIVDKTDGVAYIIECNPRLHSCISLFHNEPCMADVLLGRTKLAEPHSCPTFTTFNEWFALLDPTYYLDEESPLILRLRSFFGHWHCKDPILDEEDILPFLMIHFFQIPVLLVNTALARRPWKKIDFQIGKVVELGGH